MKKLTVLKPLLLSSLMGFFTFFVALPAFYPQPSIAQSRNYSPNKQSQKLERRAKARQRSAARLMKKALNESDPVEQSALFEVAAARCAGGDGFLCTDGQGGTTTVTSSEDCGDCKGTGAGSCAACCDDQAGGIRADLCKDVHC